MRGASGRDSTKTFNRATVHTIAAILVVVVLGPLGIGSALASSHAGRPDAVVKLQAGDPVSIVFDGATSLGGTSAPVYSTTNDAPLGTFVTEVQSGPDVISLLGAALATGASRAEEVELTMVLPGGTIKDIHTANIAVTAEPPSLGYEAVLVAIGEGVIGNGSGRYAGASGTSSLFIIFEIDADQMLPPVVRTGTLRFDFG